MTSDLRVSFAGVGLKNPVIAASGTFGYGVEFEDAVHPQRLGVLWSKDCREPPSNSAPRLYETAADVERHSPEGGARASSMKNCSNPHHQHGIMYRTSSPANTNHYPDFE
jgi:hypothetical protein